MASSINASTSGGGGIITTADATGNLNIQSGGSTVVAVTSAGATVTGTLAVSGGVTLTTTLPVLQGGTGVTTSTGTTNVVLSNSPTLVSPSISSAVMSTMASSVITSGTSVATTSGTSVTFTGIPSWVKRITVMVNGVSTNGTSNPMIQLGTSGGVTATGYVSSGSNQVNNVTPQGATLTTGFLFGEISSAAAVLSGIYIIANVSGNIWVGSFCGRYDAGKTCVGGGAVTLGSILTQVRLTTVNGTDAFDAGSVNILYE